MISLNLMSSAPFYLDVIVPRINSRKFNLKSALDFCLIVMEVIKYSIMQSYSYGSRNFIKLTRSRSIIIQAKSDALQIQFKLNSSGFDAYTNQFPSQWTSLTMPALITTNPTA